METWIRVADADDVHEGEPLGVVVAGWEVALFRVDDQVYATSNICTHGQARLSDGYQEGNLIECPLHQGQFDVRTGACTMLPVTEDLRTYPVRTRNGVLEIILGNGHSDSDSDETQPK